MDISKFFDTINHALLMKAVKRHVSGNWILRYNKWKQLYHPHIPFERYADDTVCHCRGQSEAENMKVIIMNRLADCGLKLNEEKTRIVYCKDSSRKEDHAAITFDFLGYTFRPRKAKNSKSGEYFTSFLPAVSQKSKKHIRETIHSWKLSRKKDLIAVEVQMEASARGWINYYGKFYPSHLTCYLQTLNHAIVRWAVRRYKRLKGSLKRGWLWLMRLYQKSPKFFYHWCRGIAPRYFKLKPVKIRRARMKGDFHVRFCGGLGVKLLRSTRQIDDFSSINDKMYEFGIIFAAIFVK